jgi:diacylglycerol kinase family enzyme
MMTQSALLQAQDDLHSTDSAPYVSTQLGYGHGPYFVLFNVSSGRQGDRRELLIRKYFQDAGAQARLFPIHRHNILPFVVGHAADLALSVQGTLVIAGGDGTVNSALPSVLQLGVPLGILPCGGRNHAAQQLGIPLDLEAAVHTLIHGEAVEAHVGLVNDCPFLHSASLGLYPRLLEESERAKDQAGRVLALTSAASFLRRRRARNFALDIQRGPSNAGSDAPAHLDVCTLFIGNSALKLDQSGAFPLSDTRREQDVDSNARPLAAVAVRAPSAFRLFQLGVRAAWGARRDPRDTPTFSFERLVVRRHGSSDPSVKVMLDGETLHMKGPLVIERSPEPIRIIVPSSHSTSSTRLSSKHFS